MSDPGGLPPGSVNSVAAPEAKLPTGKGAASAAPDPAKQISPARIAVRAVRRAVRPTPNESRRTRIVNPPITPVNGPARRLYPAMTHPNRSNPTAAGARPSLCPPIGRAACSSPHRHPARWTLLSAYLTIMVQSSSVARLVPVMVTEPRHVPLAAAARRAVEPLPHVPECVEAP